MVKKVIFIRHGRSTANDGEATSSNDDIPLTKTGHKQAEKVLATLLTKGVQPDLIITSTMLRARQTAAPAQAHFPGVPVQELSLFREFDYLDFDGQLTTPEQRRDRRDQYWQQCDPFHQDSPSKEAFVQFCSRLTRALDLLLAAPASCILVFTHGHFIQQLKLMLTDASDDPDGVPDPQALMQQFRDAVTNHPIPNGHMFGVEFQ